MLTTALAWMAVGAALLQALIANAPEPVRALLWQHYSGDKNWSLVTLAAIFLFAVLMARQAC